MNAVLVHDARAPGARALGRFKARHPDKVKTLRILDVDWPIATSAYQHLFAYVTNALMVDGEPLAFRCLRRALDAYEDVFGLSDKRRFDAFLTELLVPASEVLKAIHVSATPDIVWRAEDGVPLSLWLDECQCASPETVPAAVRRNALGDEASIRQAMQKFVLERNHG